MSTSYVLIVFALVIVLMIVLISKCKVNAAMGILLSAFILAIALGTPWQDIEGTINSGFSSTIKSHRDLFGLYHGNRAGKDRSGHPDHQMGHWPCG